MCKGIMLKKLVTNTIVWFIIIFGLSLFLPYGEIKKGGSTFIELQVWWYYGNMTKNFHIILCHILISCALSIFIVFLIKINMNREKLV